MTSDAPTPPALLRVDGLRVEFSTAAGPIVAVDDVSFDVAHGEMVGLVGESGSGKTVTSLAIAGLTRRMGGRVTAGSIDFAGHEMTSASAHVLADILGNELGMIFQQPTRSLNPTMRVGSQIAEVVRRHEGASRSDAWRRAVDMLDRVHIPNAAERAKDYPHMFSGGMSQRVMIAMALVCNPKLLVADEPTTALDVTVQARVLDLFTELRDDLGVAVILITHNLGVVANVCERLAVMYGSQIVETGPVREVMASPAHPYTAGLLDAIPRKGVRSRPRPIRGIVPPPHALPAGCRFHPRCDYAEPGRCDAIVPPLVPASPTRDHRCIRADELDLARRDRSETTTERHAHTTPIDALSDHS